MNDKGFVRVVSQGEIVLVGNLNLDWSSSASDSIKSIGDSHSLSQLINSPTRPNIKTLLEHHFLI